MVSKFVGVFLGIIKNENFLELMMSMVLSIIF